MAIKFLLLVNKQGQTRLAKYLLSEPGSTDERRALEGEVVRKCLARTDRQCSFFEHRAYRVVYRRYASLFFMVGVDESEVWFFFGLVVVVVFLFGGVCCLAR
jgi:AP-4 complex subunit sigma-1